MKHTFYAIIMRDGRLYAAWDAQRKDFGELSGAELFRSKAAAKEHARNWRNWNAYWKKAFRGCKIVPVYARLEAT